jgi:hypothetical protein
MRRQLSSALRHAAAPIILAGGLLIGLVEAQADASSALAYGGRLVDTDGRPLVGPVDIQLRFFSAATDGEQLGAAQPFPQTTLSDGVFQLQLTLDPTLTHQIFGDGSQAVYVEVEAGGRVYPRQRFLAVPYALRVPIDGVTLAYGNDGALAVSPIGVNQVAGLAAALTDKADAAALAGKADSVHTHAVGDVTGLAGALTGKADADAALSGDVGGSLSATSVDRIKGVAVAAPVAGTDDGKFLQYDGTGFTLSSALTTAQQNGVELKPFDTGAGQTGEIRFDELAPNGGNYVGFKAADALAGNRIWTLPAADGASGQFLVTDGAGILSWGSPAGGGDLMASANLADLSNAGTARTNLGLGPLATLSAVGSAEITDGAIANADVSATAAIATSKLSGALTAITGHGLGALATLGSIGSAEITDGAIANADVSASAALATSKLSGSVTSISGHGLGALATLGSVGAGEITDGAIGDADVSSSAAIATSKLSGAVTSITGHGLGSLATLSAVGTGEISDGAIADADVSANAAIATSKLSGAVTSISGHGLGSLATLSSVGTSQIDDGTIVDADISGSAAISSSKISFAADSISGNTIDGGVISNFASTGIDDNAASTAVTINSLGNVGIGTTSPVGKLDIYAASSPELYLRDNSSGFRFVPANGANFIQSGTAGPTGSADLHFSNIAAANTWMTIKANGNVGIGTTLPTAGLDVQAGTNASGQIRVGASGQAGKVYFARGDGSYAVYAGFPASGEANEFRFYNTSGGGFYTFYNNILGGGAAETFRIANSGNVGIGTTAPAAKLQVNGQIANTMPTTMTPTGTTQAIDWTTGNVQVLNLGSATGDVTVTMSNAVAGAIYILHVTQGATARNLTWPASVRWPSGVAPVISTTASSEDVLTFFYNGTKFYGTYGQDYR